MSDRRTQILGTVEDLVSNFLYYDRRSDEDLQRGEIERAIMFNELTVEDIVNQFKVSLEEGLR